MSSAAVSTHSGAGPLSLMSCVRESSPLQDFDSDTEKNVATKKKFWNRIKWFKRKNKVIEDNVLPVSDYMATTASESLRSRSTSELSIEEPPRKRNGSSMYPGLSVSHDSVFHSPHSGSETDLDVAHSSSSLFIPNPPQADLQTELSERLRLRRSGGGRGDTSEDDEGLPHSPCNSPTTTDTLDKTALKDLQNKSHSTCSDGSLLSVGSSDIEEDLLIGQIKHSSRSKTSESIHELDLNASSVPLNHSAAHHRVAVRPKKTHGVPKRKKVQKLPTTIEVNEDSSVRSSSPEVNPRDNAIQLCNPSGNQTSLTESQLKSSSLPLGLVAPGTDGKLNRSKSNAGSKSQDALEEHVEKEEKCDKSFFERLFPRRSAKKKKSKNDEKKQEEKKIKLEDHFTRHEDKKIENKRRMEEARSVEVFKATQDKYNIRDESFTSSSYSKQTDSSYRRYETKPIPAVRSGAAYRQRVLPIDIPDSQETFSTEEEIITTKSQLPDILSTSPLQLELENKLKQRLTRSSPPQSIEISDVPLHSSEIDTVPGDDQIIHSPKSPTTHYLENKKPEDVRPKMKIAGLSSLQQKALSLNEDEEDYHNFKSLTEFPSSPPKSNMLLTKSHSFKSTKTSSIQTSSMSVSTNKNIFSVESKDTSKNKSTSLDNVKVFDTIEKSTETVERTSVQAFSEKIEHQRQTKKQTIEIKCDITVNENDNLDEQVSRCIMETKNLCDGYTDKNHITISGPSHTAVVNVKNMEYYNITSGESQSKVEVFEKNNPKEHLISITKINVLPENQDVPPESPVLLDSKLPIASKIPKKFPEQSRARPVFNFEQINVPRKFSRDDVEIVDKDEGDERGDVPKTSPTLTTPSITPTLTTASHFKKYEKGISKKSSLVSITPDSPTKDKSIISYKSSSLDSLESDPLDSTDKSSQDSLDKLTDKPMVYSKEKPESVVLRKKSSVKESKDDEPELMKVFARRSLKLKDSENEILSQQLNVMMNENCDKARDSDKENQTDSPVKERKKSTFNENIITESINKKADVEQQPRKKSTSKTDDGDKECNGLKKKPLTFELEKKDKEVLTESNVVHSKPIPIRRNSKSEINSLDNIEVTMRKPIGDQNSAYQRSVSVNKSIDNSQNILRKQFMSRRRTDNWITNMKNEEGDKDKEVVKDEDITAQTENVTALIIEPKNFNQRKAEWEKRAQDAQKKSTP